jgi:hypothetical protein
VGSGSLPTGAIETGSVVDMAVIVVTRLRLKDHSYLADARSATLTDASSANEVRSLPPPVEAH